MKKNNICSICFEQLENNSSQNKILSCNHAFHTKCINTWLQKSNTCPLCRNIETKINTSNKYNIQNYTFRFTTSSYPLININHNSSNYLNIFKIITKILFNDLIYFLFIIFYSIMLIIFRFNPHIKYYNNTNILLIFHNICYYIHSLYIMLFIMMYIKNKYSSTIINLNNSINYRQIFFLTQPYLTQPYLRQSYILHHPLHDPQYLTQTYPDE